MTMSVHEKNMIPDAAPGINRSIIVRSGGALAGAAALLAACGQAASDRQNEKMLQLDVAMDGRTWRINGHGETGLAQMGDTLIVLGTIYPGGSFDEASPGPMRSVPLGAGCVRARSSWTRRATRHMISAA